MAAGQRGIRWAVGQGADLPPPHPKAARSKTEAEPQNKISGTAANPNPIQTSGSEF